MQEDKTTGATMPIVTRGQGSKPRRQQKRTFVETSEKEEPKKDKEPRPPTPLPFGTLDIFA